MIRGCPASELTSTYGLRESATRRELGPCRRNLIRARGNAGWQLMPEDYVQELIARLDVELEYFKAHGLRTEGWLETMTLERLNAELFAEIGFDSRKGRRQGSVLERRLDDTWRLAVCFNFDEIRSGMGISPWLQLRLHSVPAFASEGRVGDTLWVPHVGCIPGFGFTYAAPGEPRHLELELLASREALRLFCADLSPLFYCGQRP